MFRRRSLRTGSLALLALLLWATLSWASPPALAAPALAPAAPTPVASDCDQILLSLQLPGRTIEAADALDAAMEALTSQHNPDPEALGKCALYTAMLYQGAGDYSTALEAYTIARDAFLAHGDAQMIWSAHYGRAAILGAQGRYDESLAELDAALIVARTQACWLPQDLQPVAEAVTLNNQGTVQALKGDLERGETLIVEALTLLETQAAAAPDAGAAGMAGLFDQLTSADQSGSSALIEGLLGEGLFPSTNTPQNPEDALLGLFEQLFGGSAPTPQPQAPAPTDSIPPEAIIGLISGMMDLITGPCAGETGLMGIIFPLLLGGQLGPQMAAIFAPVVQNNQGEILRRSGDLAQAETVQRAAFARLEAGEGTGNTFTNAPTSVMAAAVANNLGMIFYDREDYAAALTWFEFAEERLRSLGQRRPLASVLIQIGYTEQLLANPALARTRYAEAMEILDLVQAIDDGGAAQVAVGAGLGGPSSAASLSGSLAPFADVYNLAAGLAFADGDIPQAFATTERGRSRLFLDLIRSARLRADDPTAADLLDRERRAVFLRASLQDQLAQAEALTPPDPLLVRTTREQLALAETRYAAILDDLADVEPRLRALLTTAEDTLSLTEVQALLDPEITLVSYYQFDPRTPGVTGTIAFVITREAVTPIALPAATAEAVNASLSQLARWPSVAPNQAYPKPLLDLYQLLVADLPLNTELVGIIPHQSLHKVPFAALSDGQRYLGSEHTLFFLPSASALPAIQANGGRGTDPATALIFGNPDASAAGLQPLLAAGTEALAVATTLDQVAQTRREASERRFWAEAPQATVLHLAAHGVYDRNNPLATAIYLSPGQGEDGRLTTGEVLTLNLARNELVVLSACDSNLGELSTGDEIVGLTRAFFTAGSPAVLSSLWQVEDEATSVFMQAFYRAWQREGLSRAAALQAAQEELRQSANYANPFFWAAFVLSGDPGVGAARFDLPQPTPTPTLTPTPEPPTPTPMPTNTPQPAPTSEPAAAGGIAPTANEPITPTPRAPGPGAGLVLGGGVLIVVLGGLGWFFWLRLRRLRQ
ncbi:MAG: CHAT domain-containing protein [Oscillochloridaceae bacterium umkhey_bin13]